MTAPADASLSVFAITRGGAVTARRVTAILGGSLHLPESLRAEEAPAAELTEEVHRFARVGPALAEAFTAPEATALVCVMASGVVVRSLAPVVVDKRTDPAVLVIDELGRFVIPLLSGHLGGANALAQHLARELGAQAVLTTASDVLGLLGPDLLARDLEAEVRNPAALLPVTATLVNDGQVDLWFDDEEVGTAAPLLSALAGYEPKALSGLADAGGRPGVVVTTGLVEPSSRRTNLLRLVPRWVAAGVGCKRASSAEQLVADVEAALAGAGLDAGSLRLLASARIKEDEPGLWGAAARLGVPAVFAPDEDLAEQIAAAGLQESDFVREQAGVGAVCEPAALWAAGAGARLIAGKQAGRGTTVALALMDGGRVFQSNQGRWR